MVSCPSPPLGALCKAPQLSPKGRVGPVSLHLYGPTLPLCPTSRESEESGHSLPRSSGPMLFLPGFSEVTPAAVTFLELSWVPLIHAWTGRCGHQCDLASSGVGAMLLGLGTLGSPVTSLGAGGPRSLSCKSGYLSRTEGWGCASGVQSFIRDLWAPSFRISLLKSCLSQGRVIVTPEECGSGPTAGVWRLQSGVISLNTVSSWGPGHTAQVRGAKRASFKGLTHSALEKRQASLFSLADVTSPCHPDFSWGLRYYLGE